MYMICILTLHAEGYRSRTARNGPFLRLPPGVAALPRAAEQAQNTVVQPAGSKDLEGL